MTKPTKPKIKGCYHCSQRRIDCDRTEPACLKCTDKGLKCPGLGVRYRFNAGLAARGKLVGKTVPASGDSRASLPTRFLPPIQWASEDGVVNSKRAASPRAKSKSLLKRRQKSTTDHSCRNSGTQVDISVWEIVDSDRGSSECDDSISLESSSSCFTSNSPTLMRGPTQLTYSLETHDPLTRMLFSNFSETVAAAMTLFDGPFNKYRTILLPLAAENELVRDAALAASAHQLSAKNSDFAKVGLRFQAAAINRLTQSPGPTGTHTTAVLTALMLLLVNDLVSAGNDYKILYKMMHSCMEIEESHGSRSSSSLMDFLRQQFNIMEICMQPLLGEEAGVFNLSTRFLEPLSFITQDALLYPEYASNATLIESAYHQACDVYLHRAMNNDPVERTTVIVQRLKETIEQVPQGSPGEHVLVWVYFIAAAESSVPCHREFFRERLLDVYRRIRFSNILGSLKMLERIWVNKDERWTSVIMQIEQVFIF